MAAWVHYMTRKVGRKAVQIFSQEVSVDEEEIDQDEPLQSQEASTATEVSSRAPAVVQRLRILASLAAIDGTSHDQESAFIKEMMSNCEIPSAEKDVILESLASCQQIEVKYEILAANPSDSVGILVDMVALSRRDNIVHPAERIYIRKVGEILGVAEADVNDLIETA